ncbi:hypothetical protein FRB94_002959 [Tulasnella sp. JGI-2019a]|nr:hypothetical protein FRB93_005175 [Tulasnella sp. JGI-2019a]KAG9003745.1 hypothetical protein FRB94_002959 [Tulasnella sp. JGI-2019a]
MSPILKIVPALTTQQLPLQSVEVPNTKAPGQTAHYRNPKWNDLQGELGRATLPQLFESGLAQARDMPCLGHRKLISTGTESPKWAPEYTWETYAEVDARRKAIGSALEGLFRSGVCPPGKDFEAVGIWSINRPEWQIVDMAAGAYNKVSVALYDTLGPHAVEYVINHAELPIVFSTANHIGDLIKNSVNCPSLKVIVSIDPIDAATGGSLFEAATKTGVQIMEMAELEAQGRKNPIEPIPATLDQLASVCYTSGTTSDPKGVMLSHRALASAALAHLHALTSLPPNWIVMSFLPLAHIYGRIAELLALSTGGCVGYYTGNPANLLPDMQVLKPHMFPSVPRILNRIYSQAQTQMAAPGIKGTVFRRAVDAKLAYFKSTGSVKSYVWDYFVFSHLQAMLGGRVSVIVTGSAPINKDMLDFLKISLSCEILECYALTETAACTTRTLADDPHASGTVGGPSMMNEIKLVDVPELGYRSTDTPNPRGELCVRGETVFSKYYKDEKSTEGALDADGWFHTGDVAEIDEVGRFRIVDRVKNIMKLSQGEYVALEKVDNVYSACPVVRQSYIHGESLQDFLVAIIVADPKALSQIADQAGCGFDYKSPSALSAAMEDSKVKKATLDSMTAHAKKSGLKGFEMIRGIHLTSTQFTIENNTLTPTFKIRRKDAHKMYKDVIDSMYAPTKKAQ